MISINFRHEFNQQQLTVIENWVKEYIQKYSSLSDIDFIITEHNAVLTNRVATTRVSRVISVLKYNIQFLNDNKAEGKTAGCTDPEVVKFIQNGVPMPYSLQKIYTKHIIEMDLLRTNARKTVILKKCEYYVTRALAAKPYDAELLKMYKQVSAGKILNNGDLLYLYVIINEQDNLVKLGDKNVALAKSQLSRLDAVIPKSSNDKNIMVTMRNQLSAGVPLNDDQTSVLKYWEHKVS